MLYWQVYVLTFFQLTSFTPCGDTEYYCSPVKLFYHFAVFQLAVKAEARDADGTTTNHAGNWVFNYRNLNSILREGFCTVPLAR